MKSFVFQESQQRVHHSIWQFCLVNLVAIVQTWGISAILSIHLPRIGIRYFVPEISHALGIIVPIFTSYLGHKHWTFRSDIKIDS